MPFRFPVSTMICSVISVFLSTVVQAQNILETRGLVRSSARVEVRTDLVAAVSKSPFREGSRFKKLSGLVAEEQISRLKLSGKGKFIPDDATLKPIRVSLLSLSKTAASQLPDPELADLFGGKIPVRPAKGANLIPVGSYYSVVMAVDEVVKDYPQTIRGVVLLEGEPRSFAGRVARRVAGVLIRESGF